ncbi:MAG: dihydroorotate dehydrogenase-like protein [Candidatus Omnitrophota bacterium]
MDLSTTYMGLKLKNPLVVASSPLSEIVDNYKRLEDAGISAIVNHSLFEEQITHEVYELNNYLTQGTESFAESLTYFPEPESFVLGPEEYLKHIHQAKKSVSIPVIASLNSHSAGQWSSYAKRIEEAGADALELNIYFLPTDPQVSGGQIEQTYLDILKSVKSTIKIPVAVKMNPYFSSIPNMAKRLDEAGADALVLFNRFYQPDIDLENLEVVPNIILSSSYEMRLPLRWVAILYGKVKSSLAATTGIYQAQDALKMLMAGADVTMLCATLLKNGIKQAEKILRDMEEWMSQKDYESVAQIKGIMSHKACANPSALERANYMRVLNSFE